MDKVTVALDRARDLATEARRAGERVLNGLHGEVRVAAVHDLEESDLGVTREVNVLGAIGDKLHQPSSCHLVITMPEKIIFWKVIFPRNLEFPK